MTRPFEPRFYEALELGDRHQPSLADLDRAKFPGIDDSIHGGPRDAKRVASGCDRYDKTIVAR